MHSCLQAHNPIRGQLNRPQNQQKMKTQHKLLKNVGKLPFIPEVLKNKAEWHVACKEALKRVEEDATTAPADVNIERTVRERNFTGIRNEGEATIAVWSYDPPKSNKISKAMPIAGSGRDHNEMVSVDEGRLSPSGMAWWIEKIKCPVGKSGWEILMQTLVTGKFFIDETDKIHFQGHYHRITGEKGEFSASKSSHNPSPTTAQIPGIKKNQPTTESSSKISPIKGLKIQHKLLKNVGKLPFIPEVLKNKAEWHVACKEALKRVEEDATTAPADVNIERTVRERNFTGIRNEGEATIAVWSYDPPKSNKISKAMPIAGSGRDHNEMVSVDEGRLSPSGMAWWIEKIKCPVGKSGWEILMQTLVTGKFFIDETDKIHFQGHYHRITGEKGEFSASKSSHNPSRTTAQIPGIKKIQPTTESSYNIPRIGGFLRLKKKNTSTSSYSSPIGYTSRIRSYTSYTPTHDFTFFNLNFTSNCISGIGSGAGYGYGGGGGGGDCGCAGED